MTQEEQRLEIRLQDIASLKEQFPFDPTVKAFMPSEMKISTQDLMTQKTVQLQKIKDIANKWIEENQKNHK